MISLISMELPQSIQALNLIINKYILNSVVLFDASIATICHASFSVNMAG